MKKIVVYDIAASQGGGGESILNQYLEQARKASQIEWWFFVSIDGYERREAKNIHVVFVNIKRNSMFKTYLSRIRYELFECKYLVKKINPDEIISLQNMIVPGMTCKQTVYLHQCLEFSPVKYRFVKKEEQALAFRQRIICPIIKKSLRKADKVIVQSNWMREKVAEWAGYPTDKIAVETPQAIFPMGLKHIEPQKRVFIYPANAYLYKNHQVIVEACKILKNWGYKDYRILLTLSTEKIKIYEKLWNEIEREKLPIECIGHLAKDSLFEKYQECVMLFPSYCETFGLPMLEAKQVGGRIIASDMLFSHEILDGYDKATFVEYNNAIGWAEAIKKYI